MDNKFSDKYTLVNFAYEVLDYLKESHDNLYTGELTVKQLDYCEEKLKQIKDHHSALKHYLNADCIQDVLHKIIIEGIDNRQDDINLIDIIDFYILLNTTDDRI